MCKSWRLEYPDIRTSLPYYAATQANHNYRAESAERVASLAESKPGAQSSQRQGRESHGLLESHLSCIDFVVGGDTQC